MLYGVLGQYKYFDCQFGNMLDDHKQVSNLANNQTCANNKPNQTCIPAPIDRQRLIIIWENFPLFALLFITLNWYTRSGTPLRAPSVAVNSCDPKFQNQTKKKKKIK